MMTLTQTEKRSPADKQRHVRRHTYSVRHGCHKPAGVTSRSQRRPQTAEFELARGVISPS
eukprot:COSAG01_NODE_9730_length_2360_cov_3.984962_2_plen_60_part_00